MARHLLKGVTWLALIATCALDQFNLYKVYRGHLMRGEEKEAHSAMSLVKCASTCDKWKPSCRAFVVHLPTSVCTVYTSFQAALLDADYDLYFDLDMYQDLNYKEENGSLLYYPPLAASGIRFNGWQRTCSLRWGKVFMAKTASDWGFMISIFQKMNYSNMWVPIKENKNREGTYQWLDRTDAPGELNITILDDGGANELKIYDEYGDFQYENDIDCAMISGNMTEQVQIVSCDSNFVGYICQAVFPAPLEL